MKKGNRLNSDAVPATVRLAKQLVIVVILYPLFIFKWEGKLQNASQETCQNHIVQTFGRNGLSMVNYLYLKNHLIYFIN